MRLAAVTRVSARVLSNFSTKFSKLSITQFTSTVASKKTYTQSAKCRYVHLTCKQVKHFGKYTESQHIIAN